MTYDAKEDAKRLFEERNPGKAWEEGNMDFYCDRCFELMNTPLLPGIRAA